MANNEKVLSPVKIGNLLANSRAKGNDPAAKAPPAAAPAVKTAPPPVKTEASPPVNTAEPPKAVPAPVNAAPAPAAAKAPPAINNIPQPAAAPPPASSAPPARQGPDPEQIAGMCRQLIAEQTKDLSKQILELTIKVKQQESLTQKISALEEKTGQLAEAAKTSPRMAKELGARIDETQALLKDIRQHSDEERIHDQFHCVNCDSEKLVAIHVKCTICGAENWMGWFPKGPDKTRNANTPQ